MLALNKLNYSACSFGDGIPVTLRFADAVGEIILTAAPRKNDTSAVPLLHLTRMRRKGRIKVYPSVYP